MKISAGSNPNIYKMLVDREQLPLPYFDFDKENNIYFMDDGALSVIFECKPYGGYSSEAGLSTVMNVLPEGAALQFILLPSRDVTEIVDRWKNNKTKQGEIYEVTRDSYSNFIESKISQIVTQNMRVFVSNYVLLIALTIGGRDKEHGIFDKILDFMKNKKDKSGENNNEVLSFEKNFNTLKDCQSRMRAALESANLSPVLLQPDRLIRHIYSIFNPNHDFRTIPSYRDGLVNISDRMIANDTVVEIADDHIVFDKCFARSLSVKDYAYEWSVAMAEHFIGNPFGLQTIESQVMLCLNIINEGKKGIDNVKRRSQIILSQKLPEHLFPRLAMKQRDLVLANKELEKGKKIFHINFGIMAFGNSYDHLNTITGQVKSYFQTLGFSLEEDRYINLPILLSMLPGNYDNKMKQDLGRGLPVFSENAVDLAPIAADWGGRAYIPEVFMFSPRGQLFSFDFFASNTNYNSFIIGTSGAGKSVALQYIAMNYMMSNARIFIIDIGGSYENFASILNGQYIDIIPDKPMCLNPFTDLTSVEIYKEFKEFLVDWYWLMGCPQDVKLADEHERYIKSFLVMALDLTYDKYGIRSGVDTVIECFIEVSKKEDGTLDERCQDFAQILSMYAITGPYGAFFNGECNISFTSDIVVMETGSMEDNPNLRDPILMMLTFHISKSIYLTKDFSRKVLVMIDEAHKFLGQPRIAGFIQQAYRRYRKHNASMVIGTQGWEDLADTSTSTAGRVIIENSAFQIFMAQSPASSEKLKNSTSHNFSPYEKSMIDSINSIKGEYSEAILIFEKTKMKLRFVLDDWMKRIFFTTPAMRTYIRGKVAEGMTFKEAVETMPKDLIK